MSSIVKCGSIQHTFTDYLLGKKPCDGGAWMYHHERSRPNLKEFAIYGEKPVHWHN